jgi:hypothetical protein
MVKCTDSNCIAEQATIDEAVGLGWSMIGYFPWCPLHAYGALREAKKEAVRQQLEVRAHRRNQEVAKKHFTAAEYRAWDEFQSDLADFHKKHQKLAPKVLRLMSPMVWLGEYKEKGRIDVEASAANFEEVKVARGKRTIDVLKGL